MRTPNRLLLFVVFIFCCATSFSQTWQWAKRLPTVENININPTDVLIDSKGNTLTLCGKTDRKVICKQDVYGNVLWLRSIFATPADQIAGFTLDAYDNIYFISAPLKKIDTDTLTTPGPYSLIKLSPNGKFCWAKQMNFTPYFLLASVRTTFSQDKIYLYVPYAAFTTLQYDGQSFPALGGNSAFIFLGAVDTTGHLLWGKRLFSPALGGNCPSNAAVDRMTVNKNNELFLSGGAKEKLRYENDILIDVNFNSCRSFRFGLMLNGNTGSVKWAKELKPDTLADRPNLIRRPREKDAVVLSNGYTVYYEEETMDTLVNSTFTTKELIAQLYLFDQSGNLIRKHRTGSLQMTSYSVMKLFAGEDLTFYSTGNLSPYDKFEARRMDTSFNTLWGRQVVYTRNFPPFHANEADYRNNSLSLIMQSGSESFNGTYAYFGSDSTATSLIMLVARILDSANSISGNVFIDLNKNGVRNTNEPYAANVLIGSANNDTIYTGTGTTGNYQFLTKQGTYEVKPLNLQAAYPNFTQAVPAKHTVTMATNDTFVRNRNFALQAPVDIADGAISITSFSRARPGFAYKTKVMVTNTGTVNITGSYKITYDSARLLFISSTPAPSATTGNTITVQVSNLTPLTSITNDVNWVIKSTTPIGDTLHIKAELTTSPPDVVLSNNADSVIQIVRGAYDPNDKQVYPFKEVHYDSVLAGRQELDYLIRFQNTGTDTAFTVRILDSLDSKLDLTTFRLISSSHAVKINWLNPRVAEFYFPGIMLPDSNVNEAMSHGFVRFKIKLKTSVALSDIVNNTSMIYFDYNAPVRTNTVTTSFKLPVITSVPDISSEKYLEIRPNPVRDRLYFSLTMNNLNEVYSINVYDAEGRLIMSTQKRLMTGTTESLDLSSLQQGIYYLELINSKRRFVKKVMRL